MLLMFPPTVDLDKTSTLIKHELVIESKDLSTCFEDKYFDLDKTESIVKWGTIDSIATNINLEEGVETKNSTWQELNANDFDVLISVKHRTIKVKSKVKMISKYQPKIVID